MKCDFIVSNSNSSLYIKHNGNHIVLLCIYEDDLILTDSVGQSPMSVIGMKHEFGLFLGDQSIASGYNERVNSVA